MNRGLGPAIWAVVLGDSLDDFTISDNMYLISIQVLLKTLNNGEISFELFDFLDWDVYNERLLLTVSLDLLDPGEMKLSKVNASILIRGDLLASLDNTFDEIVIFSTFELHPKEKGWKT